MIKPILTMVLMAFCCSLPAYAQTQDIQPNSSVQEVEGAVLRVKGQIDQLYVPSKTNQDATEMVVPGTPLIVRKGNLIMNKTRLPSGKVSAPIVNVFENGGLSQSGILGALGALSSFLTGAKAENHSRPIDIGSKVWVTQVSIQPSGLELKLMTDPIGDDRFHGYVRFPFASAADVDKVVTVIPDVLAFAQPPLQLQVAPSGKAPTGRQDTSPMDAEGMFLTGDSFAQRGDFVEAVRWFERASNKGHVQATNALGFFYEQGKGVPQNFAKAAATYLRAMKAGDPTAMLNRGSMYLNGRGVNKDPQSAYMHFLLASAYARDDETRQASQKLKEEVEATLTKQQVAKGQSMADKFAKDEIKVR